MDTKCPRTVPLRGKCEDERVDMCVFVDDFLSCFPKTENGRQTYSDFIEAFKKDYDLQDDGYQRCTEFTGMRLTWHPDGSLAIDQPAPSSISTDTGTADRHSYQP